MAFRNVLIERPARISVKKQYESIDILVGRLTQADESFQCEQLSIF